MYITSRLLPFAKLNSLNDVRMQIAIHQTYVLQSQQSKGHTCIQVWSAATGSNKQSMFSVGDPMNWPLIAYFI